MARILVIDNYDSFVYNLVQYLAQLGAEVDVWRNDDPRFADADWAEAYDGVLISPGPGTPESAGVCIDVVKSHCGRVPIFGVCLGLQSIAVAYGGVVNRAPELLHGKTSQVHHDGTGVLAEIAQAVSQAEADIAHIDMDPHRAGETTELRLMLAVRDRQHLADVLRVVRRSPSVMRVARIRP